MLQNVKQKKVVTLPIKTTRDYRLLRPLGGSKTTAAAVATSVAAGHWPIVTLCGGGEGGKGGRPEAARWDATDKWAGPGMDLGWRDSKLRPWLVRPSVYTLKLIMTMDDVWFFYVQGNPFYLKRF